MSERRKRIRAFKYIGLFLLLSVIAYGIKLKNEDARYQRLHTEWSAIVDELVTNKATQEEVASEFKKKSPNVHTSEANPAINESASASVVIDPYFKIWPYYQTLVPIVYFDEDGRARSSELRIRFHGLLAL